MDYTATLTKCSVKAQESNYIRTASTVLELAVSIVLPKPQAILTIEEWAARWEGGGQMLRTFRTKAAAADAPKKLKKGQVRCDDCALVFDDEEAHDAHECAANEFDDHDEEEGETLKKAEREMLGGFYAEYHAEAEQLNRTAVQAAMHSGILMALLGREVTITVTPKQQGFGELFQLTAGDQ